MVLLVAQLWFQIPFAGSFVTLYVGLAVFLLAAIGIGLLLSSVAATMQQAMLFSFLLIMPFSLLSGFDHTDQQYADSPPIPDADQSVTLCNRYCSWRLLPQSRSRQPHGCFAIG
jgi:hypothetical protein